MSFGSSSSRIARRRRRVAALPDVILKGDPLGDLGEPRIVIAEVEAKTGVRTKSVGESPSSSRARANELHREADQLYYKGDYESALVLYHRAARLYPREASHAVAARRTESAISSAANPARGLARLLRDARSPAQVPAAICPEAAARRARAIVQESPEPVNEIPKILRFFDSRKDFWRLPSADPSTASPCRTRSRTMLRQLSKCLKSTHRELEEAHQAGNAEAVHRLGSELLSLLSLTEDPRISGQRNTTLDAHGYLARKHASLGRHDRAVELAAKMAFLARSSGSGPAMVRALATLGRVHLEFGHLDALVRVWERLADDLRTEKGEELAQAWLYHDIGRCHLELGNLGRGLEASRRCLERASLVNSNKWTLRGQLLRGQVLLKSGRFVEAVTALKIAARLAERDRDRQDGNNGDGDEDGLRCRRRRRRERSIQLLAYAQSLIEQVTRLLRRLNEEREEVRLLQSQARSVTAERDSGDGINDVVGATSMRREAENKQKQQQQQQQQEQKHSTNDEEALEQKEEDEDEEEYGNEIAQLLERTRALRGINSSSMANRDKLPYPDAAAAAASTASSSSLSASDTDEQLLDEEEEEETTSMGAVVLDTSRTRTIRRASYECWSDCTTITATAAAAAIISTEVATVYDVDDDGDGKEDASARGGGCLEKTNDYGIYQQQQLHSDGSSSSSFALANHHQPHRKDANDAEDDTRQQKSSPISDYLRSLESRGFDDILSQ